MKILSENTSLALLPAQALSFQSKRAMRLRVEHGTLWITCYGAAEDYWLHAGESMVLPPSRHVVMEAQQALTRLDVFPVAPSHGAPQLRTDAKPRSGIQHSPCPVPGA